MWRIGKDNAPHMWSPHLHKINKLLLLEKILHQHHNLLKIICPLDKLVVPGRTIRPLQGADNPPLALQLVPEDPKEKSTTLKLPGRILRPPGAEYPALGLQLQSGFLRKMVLVLHLPGRIVRPLQGADYPGLKKMFSNNLMAVTVTKIKGKAVIKTRIQQLNPLLLETIRTLRLVARLVLIGTLN